MSLCVLQVTELGCSHDGRYVFTSGGEDCTATMWKVNTGLVCVFVCVCVCVCVCACVCVMLCCNS